MDSFIGFAGVGTAIIASMGLAMWMEWYCLRWLMRLMPGQTGEAQRASTTLKESEETRFTAIEPELAGVELVPAARANVARNETRLGI
jgi:hypothetical protein